MKRAHTRQSAADLRAATHPPKVRAQLSAPGSSRQSQAWGLSSRAAYQRRICDLELEQSRLQEDMDELRFKLVHKETALKYYAELYDAAPIGYVTLNELGKVLHYNQTFAELVGRDETSQDFFFGRLLTKGDQPRFLRHLNLAQRSFRPVTCELALKTRRGVIPVQLISNAQAQSRPGARRITTAVLDITQQVHTQEARAKTQSDFKALVDTIQGVVWEADPATLELTYVSARAGQLLGYPIEYWAAGASWEAHVHQEDRNRVVQAMRKLAVDGEETSIEYRMIRADRCLIWVNNSMSATSIGKRLRVFGVVMDITDRKEAEEQLRGARAELEQRVEERTAQLRETVSDLETFSYSLSHDLRAPLRAMQGYAQLLLSRLGNVLDDAGRTYFQRLIASSERLDKLIQDVLKFSQVSRAPVELNALNLEKLLDEVINDYPALLPPRVRIEVQKPLLKVYGHEAFLTQCLTNLLSNAVKFSRVGETPRVRILTQRAKRGRVRVWFEDNGIGIAPEDQRRIFGIFERIHPTERYEGTGVGLAIVAKAVERMGGNVGVESKPGEGSRFWLELPAAVE